MHSAANGSIIQNSNSGSSNKDTGSPTQSLSQSNSLSSINTTSSTMTTSLITTTAYFSSSSSSASSPSSSSSSSSSSHNIMVGIDFETGLKIDITFECAIASDTSIRDLIAHILKKLNSFIDCYNMINKNGGILMSASDSHAYTIYSHKLFAFKKRLRPTVLA